MKSHYTIFQVKPGWMGLVGNEKGVQRIYLPGLSREDLLERIRREFPESEEGAGFLEGPRKELVEYFEGRREQFEMPLDLSRATPFQKRAYGIMSGIPF